MLAHGCCGSRYSFGYPACPNLADQRELVALLRAEEIGIPSLKKTSSTPSNRPPPSTP
jgi:cobalamin-dependent methionine synthase I